MTGETVAISGTTYCVRPLEANDVPRPLQGVKHDQTTFGPADFFAHVAERRLFVRLWVRETDEVLWRELTPMNAASEFEKEEADG